MEYIKDSCIGKQRTSYGFHYCNAVIGDGISENTDDQSGAGEVQGDIVIVGRQ